MRGYLDVMYRLRQQGSLRFFVAGFSPAGRKTSNDKTIATALPKAKTSFAIRSPNPVLFGKYCF
jgi:hypothetical protein